MCPAEFSSCTENDGDLGSEETERGLADYDDRLHHQQNAMAATRAAQAGDTETYNDIMASDSSLVAQDCGCTLVVRGGTDQSLSPGNPLEFPGASDRKLGPVATRYYWGYRIEESGTVPDDASEWVITRTIVDRNWGVYNDGSSSFGGKIKESSETANTVWQPAGSRTFYSIDAPGIPRWRNLPQNATYYYEGNYTTRLSKGNLHRDFRWYVRIQVTSNGKVTGQFRFGHKRLR
jgi:hypothetical protein